MKNYEQISKNCQILWHENFKITNEKYTQVSGYIFNDKQELLIVKNENTWTIPGGHPESGETPLETLTRELMEEACVTLKEPHYLGSVEVIENNQTYYQLRYVALVKDIHPFIQKWEICERKFVPLAELHNYITWSQGITFHAQIMSANNYLKNNLQ